MQHFWKKAHRPFLACLGCESLWTALSLPTSGEDDDLSSETRSHCVRRDFGCDVLTGMEALHRKIFSRTRRRMRRSRTESWTLLREENCLESFPETQRIQNHPGRSKSQCCPVSAAPDRKHLSVRHFQTFYSVSRYPEEPIWSRAQCPDLWRQEPPCQTLQSRLNPAWHYRVSFSATENNNIK